MRALSGSIAVAIGFGLVFLGGNLPVPIAPQSIGLNDSDVCEDFSKIFEYCEVEELFSDEVEAGELISQSVPAGFNLFPGESISLSYSKGPERVEFPDIVRMDYDKARKLLSELGFEVVRVSKDAETTMGANRIVAASFSRGELAPSGAQVDLVVSAEQVELPHLEGKTRQQVEADLDGLDLEIIFDEKESDQTPGVVLSQEPQAGAVAKGSAVRVTFAKAPEIASIRVPQVVGLTEVEAQGILAAAGFSNISVVKVESSKAEKELVNQVVPGVGREAESDSTILLVVTIPEK